MVSASSWQKLTVHSTEVYSGEHWHWVIIVQSETSWVSHGPMRGEYCGCSGDTGLCPPSTNTTLRQSVVSWPRRGEDSGQWSNSPTNTHQSRNIKFVDWQICKDMQVDLAVARLHFKRIFQGKVYDRMISSESATIFIFVKTKLGQRGKTFKTFKQRKLSWKCFYVLALPFLVSPYQIFIEGIIHMDITLCFSITWSW